MLGRWLDVIAEMSPKLQAVSAIVVIFAATWKASYPNVVKPVFMWFHGMAALPGRVQRLEESTQSTNTVVKRMDEAVSNGGTSGIAQVVNRLAVRSQLLIRNEAAWEADESGAYTKVYPGVTKMLGWKPEDLTNMGWPRILHPEDREEYMAAWENAVASVVPFEFPRDGSVRVRNSRNEFINVRVLAYPTKRSESGLTLPMWAGVFEKVEE